MTTAPGHQTQRVEIPRRSAPTVLPQKHRLELSNGMSYELHHWNALDLVDFESSGLQTDDPNHKRSMKAVVYMLWLSCRDVNGAPTFEQFAQSIPVEDLNGPAVREAVDFINIPFSGFRKDTQTSSSSGG